MTRGPLITLQRSIAEAGRIRIGKQVPTSGGRSRPAKLETFRLTSSDKRRIEQAAEAYGGTPAEWEAPAGKQWEVVTERAELDVVVPPSDLSFSQAYELWSAGGCQRRCDGINEEIGQRPCVCDPAARECDIHTRLSVLLRDLPGLGVWRLDTQGYYAAVELQGAIEIINIAAGAGGLLPARLRLDQRSVKRPDERGKPQTRRFAVPVLDIEVTPAALLASRTEVLSIDGATARPKLTPVPLLEGGTPSIAEQAEPPAPKTPRRNAAPPIPSSGRSRTIPAAMAENVDTVKQATREIEAAIEQPAETSEEPSAGGSSRKRPAGGCTHPADARDSDADDRPICLRCGEVLDEAPAEQAATAPQQQPTAEETPAAATGEVVDADYWQKRLHAVAGERDIDHDGLRLIAKAAKRIPADDDFSMTELDDPTAEGLDKVLRSFPESLDLDYATEWVAKIAERRGLATWDEIDPLATAALSTSLDEATVADWIAFGLRLHAGEYDPPTEAEAEEPEPPAPKARSRARKETSS